MTTEEYIALVTRNIERGLTAVEFEQLNIETAANAEWATLRLEIEDTWDVAGADHILVAPQETSDMLSRIIASGTTEQKQASTHINNTSPRTKAKIFSITSMISAVAASVVLVAAIWLNRSQDTVYDSAGEYVLTDQTRVTLREGSILKVGSFDESQRNVILKGEAFFEVSHDANRPFKVLSNHVTVEVLGTSFLVKENGEDTYIDLIEGKIRTLDMRSQEKKILTAGMQAHHMSDGSIETTQDRSNLSAWRAGFYLFDNVTLGEALVDLSLIFDTDIILDDTSLGECNFSATLAGDTINEILGRIAKIHKMELKQYDNQWILSGGSCN